MATSHSRRSRRPRVQRKPGSSPGILTIDPGAHKSVLSVMAYDSENYVEKDDVKLDDLHGFTGKWPVTWINVNGLGDADTLTHLGKMFGLHNLALEDVVNVDQRAKAEEYEGSLFIVARMVSPGDRLDTEQVSLFVARKIVLTFQERAGDCFDAVRHRIRTGRKRIRSSGPDYLAYALLDALIDNYFPVVEKLGEEIERLEDEVLGYSGKETAARIQSIKGSLLTLRRTVWPHRDALRTLLRDEMELIGKETTIFFRDCFDHTAQIIDLVESYRETCSDLMSVYLSTLSNKMNEVMKVLTIIATIFIPLSFIAGVYGMNFDPERSPFNMPELRWYLGYPLALGLMAVVAIGLLLYFWRKRWLG